MANAAPTSTSFATSPFLWLADERFAVWMTRLFWLLLILETFLWTSIGRLFTHGEIIAPVLFATSKATLLVVAAHVLAWLRAQPKAAENGMRSAFVPISSALFMLWFAVSLVHALSVLLVWLINAVAAAQNFPGSNAWDVIDLALRETELTSFQTATPLYMLISSLGYGLIALGLLKLAGKYWPPRRLRGDGGLDLLPPWPVLMAVYGAIAIAHMALMQVWVS